MWGLNSPWVHKALIIGQEGHRVSSIQIEKLDLSLTHRHAMSKHHSQIISLSVWHVSLSLAASHTATSQTNIVLAQCRLNSLYLSFSLTHTHTNA